MVPFHEAYLACPSSEQRVSALLALSCSPRWAAGHPYAKSTLRCAFQGSRSSALGGAERLLWPIHGDDYSCQGATSSAGP